MPHPPLVAVILVSLALAAPATAHIEAVPPFLAAGDSETISLTVPNERDAPMTGFRVVVPSDFRIVAARPAEGWSAEVKGASANWHGGSLSPGAETTFTLEVEAPTEPGPATLEAEQHYPDEAVARWAVYLTVTPAAETPSQNLGWAVVAAVLGLLALTAFGIFVWRRRSAPLQER